MTLVRSYSSVSTWAAMRFDFRFTSSIREILEIIVARNIEMSFQCEFKKSHREPTNAVDYCRELVIPMRVLLKLIDNS